MNQTPIERNSIAADPLPLTALPTTAHRCRHSSAHRSNCVRFLFDSYITFDRSNNSGWTQQSLFTFLFAYLQWHQMFDSSCYSFDVTHFTRNGAVIGGLSISLGFLCVKACHNKRSYIKENYWLFSTVSSWNWQKIDYSYGISFGFCGFAWIPGTYYSFKEDTRPNSRLFCDYGDWMWK